MPHLCLPLILRVILLLAAATFAFEGNSKPSLAELMKLDIDAGTLTGMTRSKVPVSLTTITAEDIAATPARNINDLLEVYVPGLLWMNHHENAHIGIRGIISDRNYKFLMLVNGRSMGQKGHAGAVTELENWDLRDIEKIEVIRGPGSVTYGPGAILGIINIKTKSAMAAPGFQAGAGTAYPYGSYGLNGAYGKVRPDFQIYGYGSVVSTQGVAPSAFVGLDSNVGYVGKDFTKGQQRFPPTAYFADFRGTPQVKLHVEANFLEEFTLWGRVTSAGSAVNGVNPRILFFRNGDRSDSDWTDWKQNQMRQGIVNLENAHEFSENLIQKTTLSLSSQDWERHDSPPVDSLNKESMLNLYANFSEWEGLIRTLSQLRLSDRFELAAGFEFSRNYFGPGWGDNRNRMRMGDNREIISGTSSEVYLADPARATKRWYFVGSGWDTHTYSLLGEANLAFHPRFTLLLSGRADKNTYSKWGLSPRVAVVSELNEKNILKAIWQRSVRLNTAEQLLVENRSGKTSEPEVLQGYELIYSALPTSTLNLSLSGFYNEIGILGWNTSTPLKDGNTNKLGDLSLMGLEAEAQYSSGPWTVGASHSFVQELDWKMSAGTVASGISYADYNKTVVVLGDTMVIKGYGKDLNNWANHASKAFLRCQLGPKVRLHMDTRVFWGFDGAQDGLSAIEAATRGSVIEAPEDRALALVRAKDTYGMDARVNTSASYAPVRSLQLTAYAMNLLGVGDNKRYSYDAGIQGAWPARVGFVEEPMLFGIRADYGF